MPPSSISRRHLQAADINDGGSWRIGSDVDFDFGAGDDWLDDGKRNVYGGVRRDRNQAMRQAIDDCGQADHLFTYNKRMPAT
ncbi:MAG: hypothetical protein JWN98_1881 [Abditibacteriota bacterium]|nr:hypothetical protein [Abditibacteriota bacterium]